MEKLEPFVTVKFSPKLCNRILLSKDTPPHLLPSLRDINKSVTKAIKTQCHFRTLWLTGTSALLIVVPSPSVYSHIFGLNGKVRGNIAYVDDQTLLYPAGSNLIFYNTESKNQRTITVNEGGNMVGLSVSFNQRYAAVVIEADKPTIIIYDMIMMKKKKVLVLNEGTSKVCGSYPLQTIALRMKR
jgi:CheY-specific phosphatase CheX